MRRLRVLALSGAMLIGLAVPSVVEADGKAPASTYLVSLNPRAGNSGLFAALQADLLGLTVLDTYTNAVSGFAAATPIA